MGNVITFYFCFFSFDISKQIRKVIAYHKKLMNNPRNTVITTISLALLWPECKLHVLVASCS